MWYFEEAVYKQSTQYARSISTSTAGKFKVTKPLLVGGMSRQGFLNCVHY
jgi:hypothetical protein